MILPAELMPLFDGAYPSCIVTGSPEGIPNICNLTRVWHAEDGTVAIANQLLNKTRANLHRRPLALLKLVHPGDFRHWELSVRYLREEDKGPLFDRIRTELEAISWMAGVELAAPLKSVLLLQVTAVRVCTEEAVHLQPSPERYGELLSALADAHGWKRLSYWVPGDRDGEVKLKASRGVPGAGVEASALSAMERLACWVRSENRVIRFHQIRSQLRYLHSIRPGREEPGERMAEMPITEDSPAGYLAFPVPSHQSVAGMVICEDPGEPLGTLASIEDGYIRILSGMLGEALSALSADSGENREALFKQAVERAKLKWDKETDPFYTALSARERQVAIHVAKGSPNAEIARALFISPRTVTTHLERIYQKLEVASRSALTRYVMEKGLQNGE
ncbi:response regulator transcription factor [Gorillibacterium sp. sgz5001074]|uniref:response regulator transcription factor n=1 Tax=Gorillibacterium sp. sgz5001074 TaxID=3446695 RepID=UPI003F681DE7